MIITDRLKNAFRKDYKLPIRVYDEPYWSERLNLFDPYYGCKEKWNLFLKEISKFNIDEEYFAHYNSIKDSFLYAMKNTEAYNTFINDSSFFQKLAVKQYGISRSDIFKQENDGKCFISFDLVKGNYTAMKYYSPSLVENTQSYEELMSKYTDMQHIINSKYIRQVVFGNCNPKRQVIIQQWLMSQLVEELLKYINISAIVYFSADEVIVDCSKTDLTMAEMVLISAFIQDKFKIKIRSEFFELKKMPNSNVYIKKTGDGILDIKGASHLTIPIVIRALRGEEVQENDKVFIFEGCLSKFINIPNMELGDGEDE